ncbi:hypothetical protein [Pseudoalteromonas byunsanensis]|uniref:Uncharacterized protein n=1 Tax=Pseudoalteromonas byunsanensis TaxID=327939 RepID=A0A1S1NHK0_9GAMM|nr:hypothetical protein [Pseudoalteromonas byunsanensis]OHU98142.1 hypothetical protein BIW53_00010 [Pseudoalteromonas byunsanensis]
MRSSSNRLFLLNPSISFALTFVKAIVYLVALILPGIALTISLTRFSNPFKEAIENNQILTVVLLALLAALIYSTPWLGNVNKKFNVIELSIYRLCSQFKNTAKQGWKCWAVPYFLKVPEIEHHDQTVAVNAIIGAINKDAYPDFSIILGPSASGKTRSIARIVKQQAAMSNNGIQYLYYDLNERVIEGKLVDNIGSDFHLETVVFIDNLHQASFHLINTLTKYLSNSHFPEKHIILIAQPLDRWKINPSVGVKLIEMAKESSCLYKIEGIKEEKIFEFIQNTDLSKEISELRSINRRYIATATQTTFITSLMSKPLGKSDLREELLPLLDDSKNLKFDDELIRRLAISLSLAIHRGRFHKIDFIKLHWSIQKDCRLMTKAYSLITSLIWLNKMKNLGIFPMMVTSEHRYILHEQLAEDWKDQLFSLQAFRHLFNLCIEYQVSWGGIDGELSWYLAVEIQDESLAVRYFDHAVAISNFKRMINCFNRNRFNLLDDSAIQLQYALLLDKVGDFHDARKILGKVERKLEPTSKLFAQLALAKIEVEHNEEALQYIKQLKESGHEIYRLAAEYWDIHINAHLGRFAPDELLNLLERVYCLSSIRSSVEKEVIHLLSRIVFDGCRHSYLQGHNVSSFIESFLSHDANTLLYKYEPQYQALLQLYRHSHWFGHEFMFRSELLGAKPDSLPIPKFINIGNFSRLSLEERIDYLIESYNSSRELFLACGGREFSYLSADLLNLYIIKPSSKSDEVERKLAEYQSFINETGFKDIFSYPYYYILKWNLIRLEDAFLSQNAIMVDLYVSSAKKACLEMEQLDENVGNHYGVWRASFFKTLLLIWESDAVERSSHILERLKVLKKSAKSNRFFRDVEIINWLTEGEVIEFQKLFRLFKFYPFVHQ